MIDIACLTIVAMPLHIDPHVPIHMQRGDVLLAVNGVTLPSTSGYSRDVSMLSAPSMYPLLLKFIKREDAHSEAVAAAAAGGESLLASLKRCVQVTPCLTH